MTSEEPRPEVPRLYRSTHIGLLVMAGVLLAGAAVPFLPYPAGWIWFVALIYIVLPLGVMTLNDLGRLRQERMLIRNLKVLPPTMLDPDGVAYVEKAPLAIEHLVRWRSWARWLLICLAAFTLMLALRWNWLPIALVLCVAIGREFYLAMNVVEWMTPETWGELATHERIRLRLSMGTMALGMAIIAFGIAGVIVYLFLISAEPLRWNAFAFAAVYGVMIWPAFRTFTFLATRAVRRVPVDEPLVEREL